MLRLQLRLQHQELGARLLQAGLEEMLKKEEGRRGRPDCWIQVRLQAGNEIPNTKASDGRQRHVDRKRRRGAPAPVRVPPPLLADGGVQAEHVTTHTQPLYDTRRRELTIRGPIQGPEERVRGARVDLRPFPKQPEDFVLSRAVHGRRDIATSRLGENLKHEPLFGEGNVLPPKAHARIGAQHECKADHVGCGCAAQAERGGRCPSKFEDREHDISGNRSPTNHRLTILKVRLHLAVSTAETSDGVPNSGLGQAQVSVPRIDGRKIRLQAACGDLTLLPQIPKVGEQVGRACRERGDWRLPLLLLHTRAEIEPTLELAGIAAPGRRATACNEELRRHPFAREVVRQLA